MEYVATKEYDDSLLPTDPELKREYLDKSEETKLYERQLNELKSLSNSIYKASREFDVDANTDDSPLDKMV